VKVKADVKFNSPILPTLLPSVAKATLKISEMGFLKTVLRYQTFNESRLGLRASPCPAKPSLLSSPAQPCRQVHPFWGAPVFP
jgi:hypothetical protein